MGHLVVATGRVLKGLIVDLVLCEVRLHVVLGGQATCLPEAVTNEDLFILGVQNQVKHILIH